jgi:phenylalanyl-tRNA synthetase alpha chain
MQVVLLLLFFALTVNKVVYGIADIRVFWSRDARFHSQFAGRPLDAQIQYAPYSKFPLTSRDISFWLPDDGSFHDNVFYEVHRALGVGNSVS